MIDAPTLLHDYLVAQSALTALTSTRIWKEHVTPPIGYKPSQGGAIVFRKRGGQLDYSRAIWHSSWQFKCYAASAGAAQAVYQKLVDVLDDKMAPGLNALLEIDGQTLVEPETGFEYVLCFFETWMRA